MFLIHYEVSNYHDDKSSITPGRQGFFFLSINFLATLNHSYGISVGHQCKKKAAAKLGKYTLVYIFPNLIKFSVCVERKSDGY